LTLDHWYERTLQAREAIVAMYDERFYRMWQFYLAGAAAAFRHGGLCNYQVQLSRSRLELPLTRDYITRAEQAHGGTGNLPELI
jgi:cyclopropane-fatty-acyl-phospholipid synthase